MGRRRPSNGGAWGGAGLGECCRETGGFPLEGRLEGAGHLVGMRSCARTQTMAFLPLPQKVGTHSKFWRQQRRPLLTRTSGPSRPRRPNSILFTFLPALRLASPWTRVGGVGDCGPSGDSPARSSCPAAGRDASPPAHAPGLAPELLGVPWQQHCGGWGAPPPPTLCTTVQTSSIGPASAALPFWSRGWVGDTVSPLSLLLPS